MDVNFPKQVYIKSILHHVLTVSVLTLGLSVTFLPNITPNKWELPVYGI
jgi:hypothetical protein